MPETATADRTRWLAVSLTFLTVVLDGFDTAVLSLIAPLLSREWDISVAEFSYPLTLTNVGVVAGYLACGRLGVSIGPRRLLVIGTVLYGVATAGSAAVLPAHSITLLTITRVIAGIGLGVVLPTAVVVATSNVMPKLRQSVAVGIPMGITSGAAIAGFLGTPLLHAWGSDAVLWMVGLIPLLVGASLALVSINPFPKSTPEGVKEANPLRLLQRDVRSSTIALWGAAFLIFLVAYTFKSWLPTLLGLYGFSDATAGRGLGFESLGGITGAFILMYLSARIGSAKSLFFMSIVGAAAVVCVALIGMSAAMTLAIIFVAGGGVVAGQLGQAAIAVSIYSLQARGTGVGWAAAMGRMGSIVGPAVAGVLLALAWHPQSIVLLLAFPILCTSAIWIYLSRRTRFRRGGAGNNRRYRRSSSVE